MLHCNRVRSNYAVHFSNMHFPFADTISLDFRSISNLITSGLFILLSLVHISVVILLKGESV